MLFYSPVHVHFRNVKHLLLALFFRSNCHNSHWFWLGSWRPLNHNVESPIKSGVSDVKLGVSNGNLRSLIKKLGVFKKILWSRIKIWGLQWKIWSLQGMGSPMRRSWEQGKAGGHEPWGATTGFHYMPHISFFAFRHGCPCHNIFVFHLPSYYLFIW